MHVILNKDMSVSVMSAGHTEYLLYGVILGQYVVGLIGSAEPDNKKSPTHVLPYLTVLYAFSFNISFNIIKFFPKKKQKKKILGHDAIVNFAKLLFSSEQLFSIEVIICEITVNCWRVNYSCLCENPGPRRYCQFC